MGNRTDLRDRLYQEMLASDRDWSAVEIARSTLKIVSEAKRAEHLVGAILSGDPRFEKSGSGWRVRPTPAPRLVDLAFLLADAPRSPVPGQAVSIHLQPYEPMHSGVGEVSEVSPDGAGLERLGSWLGECQIVSMSAPMVRHQLHWLESVYALPSASDSVIDLAGALRLGGEPLPEAFERESRASTEERLAVCRQSLRRLLELHGEETLDQLERRITEAQGGEQVDFEPFRFGSDLLDRIPEGPGVYRFLGEGNRLLYVGKSRNLRRRLHGYFRPLAPDHARRRRLLEQTRDLTWETTPSELEARVLESEAIRREGPLLNRQVDLHPGSESVPVADRDLAFILGEGETEEVSLFLLRDGLPTARCRLPRKPHSGMPDDLNKIVAAWMGGHPLTESPLLPIEKEESLLVLRYMKIFGDRIDRLRLTDFVQADRLVDALIELAGRPRPDTDAWLVREAHRPIS